ncbi:unnamed protein product [Staurois parvus]|uniref:Uncharacterized protein n=1 Tax=Staurois parvus TaxID=386267 RepID=A0ABN9HUW9_9NEOB|nr:unnamed protein product [Staurois parvus]
MRPYFMLQEYNPNAHVPALKNGCVYKWVLQRPSAGTEQNQEGRMSPAHRGSPIWV